MRDSALGTRGSALGFRDSGLEAGRLHAGRTGLPIVLPAGRPLSLRPDISCSQIYGMHEPARKCAYSDAFAGAGLGMQLDSVVT
jgi:hypothetical protein